MAESGRFIMSSNSLVIAKYKVLITNRVNKCLIAQLEEYDYLPYNADNSELGSSKRTVVLLKHSNDMINCALPG